MLHGLYEQYRHHVIHYFDLHPHPEMDEASDAEDPEAEAKEEAEALRQEAADTRALNEATPGDVENRSLLTELCASPYAAGRSIIGANALRNPMSEDYTHHKIGTQTHPSC